ncbi:hypothetical protein Tco_1448027 [Tanacetum coccineum]
MAPLIRTTMLIALWEQLIRENEKCQCGAGCSSKLYTESLESSEGLMRRLPISRNAGSRKSVIFRTFRSTELPKGEHPEKGQGIPYQGSRPPRMTYGAAKGNNGHSTLAIASMSTDDQNIEEGNLDRYYDYHGEKGHYTNDCYQLKRQQEAA